MLFIATDFTWKSYEVHPGACEHSVITGQVGFAGFSVSSSQDFMFQGEGVTFHSFLKRFYFHGYYHKYSLLNMQDTHLIPFCPEKN